MVAEKRGLLVSGNRDDVFSKIGYSNWKKALQSFEKHENTISHREAVQMLIVTIPQTTRDVGDMLSDSHAAAKAENRKMLEVIISSIRFLGRQGLALRVLDTIIATISERFNQPGYQMLQKLELLITSENDSTKSDLAKDVVQFYGTDFSSTETLLTQLHLLKTGTGKQLNDFQSIVSYFKTLTTQH
jgi:hypothetical protein